ncbi:MAG: sensor domain-containing diguanylate cyclase [Fusobacteriaceae bacterium]
MLMKVFDNMSTGIVILDKDARVKFYNKYMGDFLKKRDLIQDGKDGVGELFGNLFSCIHTEKNDKRCGETYDCLTCPLRSSIPQVSKKKQIVVFEKEFYQSETGVKNYYGISMKPFEDSDNDDILIELFQIKNSDMEILSIYNEHLSIKIDEYKEKMYLDVLTGLYNRNFFEDKSLDIYVDLEETGISVIDLDGLKKINDNSGHIVGDRIIKETAELIKNIVAENGYCIRMGGDEFVIIFKGNSEMSNLLNQKILEEGKRCEMFFSIGYSERRCRNEKIENLLKRADEAMYTAKKNGKGKFVIGY